MNEKKNRGKNCFLSRFFIQFSEKWNFIKPSSFSVADKLKQFTSAKNEKMVGQGIFLDMKNSILISRPFCFVNKKIFWWKYGIDIYSIITERWTILEMFFFSIVCCDGCSFSVQEEILFEKKFRKEEKLKNVIVPWICSLLCRGMPVHSSCCASHPELNCLGLWVP